MSPVANIGCESLEVYIDGELSAAESAAFDKHAAGCSACQQQLERQLRLRARLRAGLARPAANDALRRRVLSSLPQDRPAIAPHLSRRRWMEMAAAASVAAIVASSATFYLVHPAGEEGWQQAILAAHLRATMSGHVIDVASSDRHTVKPWFGGKTKVAPIVIDLADAGYPLIGGRLDIPQKDALPVLIYKAGPHVVSVYVRAADGTTPGAVTKINGFSILSWSDDGLIYSAVSDADGAELAAFQHAFAAARQKLP
ncbi:MAG TPA: zf-HC2 domain-containing protein [Dongiaceae bacterium]|jgi:anti-sigma factor RsiW